MAEKDDIQAPGIETCFFHCQQCRWPAVHEKEPIGGFDEITALVAPAITESIATAENVKFHEFIGAESTERCVPVEITPPFTFIITRSVPPLNRYREVSVK